MNQFHRIRTRFTYSLSKFFSRLGRLWVEISGKIVHKILARKRPLLRSLGYIGLSIAIILWFFIIVPSITNGSIPKNRENKPLQEDELVLVEKEMKAVKRRIQTIQYKINRLSSVNNYLVINTNENHFELYQRGKIIRQGICSTGSYTLLKGGENQSWVFKTPKGLFRIQGKKSSPVWKKPDWAFVEEGLPIPPVNHHSRFEYGVLGDYALSLGDGYLIHGTLYKRFLGLPVTHGCIRLNDEDLFAVFNSMEAGSRVYIF